MIKAVIFDCFGVLITDALEAILSELETKNSDKTEQIVRLLNASNNGQIPTDEAREEIAGILGITPVRYMEKIRSGEQKNENLLVYIKSLRPRFKIGMLSNVGRDGLKNRFTSEELSEFFDEVIISGEIGYAKPDPVAYEIAAGRLGVRFDECVMIDDRKDYCQGAINVGMRAIQYQSVDQVKKELNKY